MTEVETTPDLVEADPPFDIKSPGDCVLRSKDGISFKVHRYTLCLASEFLRSMFNLPQPQGTPPIIDMEEDAETLRAFLLTLHPVPVPSVTTYELASKLTSAFIKFDVTFDKLREALRPLYKDEEMLYKHGLDLYALAWKTGMEAEVKVASRHTHHRDLTGELVSVPLVERAGDVKALLALLDLRCIRARGIEDIVRKLDIRKHLCEQHGGYPPTDSDSVTLAKNDKAFARALFGARNLVEQALKRPRIIPFPPNLPEFFHLEELASLWEYYGDYPCQDCNHGSLPSMDEESEVIAAIENLPQEIRG